MAGQDRAFVGKNAPRVQMALRRVAGAGGGAFEAGGDLTGTSTDQTVAAIQGMPTPSGDSAQVDQYLRANSVLSTPRSLQIDDDVLWVGESGQSGVVGSPNVTAFAVSDPSDLQLVHNIDLSSVLPAVDRVRDLAQDDTYLFVACWDAEHVAIIEKATGAIAGWAYAPDPNGTRVLSVTTDGAGKLFAMVLADWSGTPTPYVARWDLASCLGQAPGTVAPEATCVLPNPARRVRYGARGVFVFDANFGTGIFRVDPIAMAISATYAAPGCFMSGIVANGSLWAVDLYGPLLRLNPYTLAVESSVALPGAGSPGPIEIEFGPDGVGGTTMLWVSDSFTQVCWSVNPTTETPTAYAIPSYTEGVVGDSSHVFLGAYVGTTPNTPGIVVLDPAVPSASVEVPLALVYDDLPLGAPTVVWRPAGPVDASNVFLTWPEVIAACQQIQGIKTIYVDSAAAVVPAGDWNPGGYTIMRGRNQVENGSTQTSVTFTDARIRNIYEFDGLALLNNSGSLSAIDQSYQSGSRIVTYRLRHRTTVSVTPGSTPFFLLNVAPRDVHLYLHDDAQVQTGTGPVILSTLLGAGLVLHLQDVSRFQQNCWQSATGGPLTTTLASPFAVLEEPQFTPPVSVANRNFLSGSGAPNGVVDGRTGDLYTSVGGGANVTLWVKESSPTSNTGWVAK